MMRALAGAEWVQQRSTGRMSGKRKDPYISELIMVHYSIGTGVWPLTVVSSLLVCAGRLTGETDLCVGEADG